MDGRRAGSCPLQLQVRIGPVWRISSSKGTAVGMSLELTCVVSRPTKLERNQRLGEVRLGLFKQGLKKLGVGVGRGIRWV